MQTSIHHPETERRERESERKTERGEETLKESDACHIQQCVNKNQASLYAYKHTYRDIPLSLKYANI